MLLTPSAVESYADIDGSKDVKAPSVSHTRAGRVDVECHEAAAVHH